MSIFICQIDVYEEMFWKTKTKTTKNLFVVSCNIDLKQRPQFVLLKNEEEKREFTTATK